MKYSPALRRSTPSHRQGQECVVIRERIVHRIPDSLSDSDIYSLFYCTTVFTGSQDNSFIRLPVWLYIQRQIVTMSVVNDLSKFAIAPRLRCLSIFCDSTQCTKRAGYYTLWFLQFVICKRTSAIAWDRAMLHVSWNHVNVWTVHKSHLKSLATGEWL